MIKNKVFCAIIVALSFMLLCPAGNAQEVKTMKIGMAHWIAFAPLNVADVKGFWKEQGLNVELKNYVGEGDGSKALIAKAIDGEINMVGSFLEELPTYPPSQMIMETDWSNGGDKIIIKNDFNLAELKGKKIGVYDDASAVTFFLNKYLAAQGLKISDVSLVVLDPEELTTNFINGRMQVIVNYDPQAMKAAKEGNGRVVATTADYPGCMPEAIYLREDSIKALSEDGIGKFVKGWVKAVEWINNPANWAEFVTIINTKTFEGESAYSEADLKEMLASVKIHNKAELIKRNETGLQSYLKELQEFMKANGKPNAEFNPAQVIDTTGTLKALQ